MIEIWRYLEQQIGQAHNSIFGPNHGIVPLDEIPWQFIALLMVAILIATSLHEFGHAWMADRLGDPTPRKEGRVSPWPWAHVDLLGLGLFIASSLTGLPFGWGKKLNTDAKNYTVGVRWGTALVAISGPAMNLVTALLLAPLARFILGGGMGGGAVAQWTFLGVAFLMLISLSLFFFNLVPVYPLDSSIVLASLLPEPLAKPYRYVMRHFGYYILLALMFTNTLTNLIAPIVIKWFLYLIGL